MITVGLIWRAFVAILLFLVGKLVSTSPETQEQMARIMAKIGLAKADTEEDIRKAGDLVVKLFYALSLLFVILLGHFAYHHLRTGKIQPYQGLTPYETSKAQPGPYGQPGMAPGQVQPQSGGAVPGQGVPRGY